MVAFRRPAALLFVAFVLCAARRAPGEVDAYLGKPVVAVRLTVDGRDTLEPLLLQLVATRVGQPLAIADVRESITHLFSLGRFGDILVDATATDAGVTLRYELSPVHPISKIEFRGDVRSPGVDEGHLRRVVIDRFGVSPPAGRGTDVARLVSDALLEAGYRHAIVTPSEDVQGDVARLLLRVEPGARTVVGAIDVDGVAAAERGRTLSELHLAPGVPFEPEALGARIDRYIEGQRKRGYYEAKVTRDVRFTPDERIANVTLKIDSGPHVRVVFAGDSWPTDQRAELVPVQREGSADEDLLEDSSNRIEEYLRAQGYREAAAPHAREQVNGELVITFNVKKGPQFRVDRVTLSGNDSIPLTTFEPSLQLRAGQPFSDARLDSDLSFIEAVYRRQGFARAKAQQTIDLLPAAPGTTAIRVVIAIAVSEGVRTMVGSVRVEGTGAVEPDALLEDLGLQAGEPYFDAQLAADRDAIQVKYANLGYQNATVEARANFSEDGTRADPVFVVREGSQIVVDHVLIVGNVRTSSDTIQRELQLKSGDPLGLAAVNESQRRLAALGLFRRTTITELKHGDERARDLVVTVEEAPVTTIGYGAGGEVKLRVVQENGLATQRLDFAPRASFQVSRRNLFGKNRSGTLFTSFSLHSSESAAVNEYRIVGSFREPRLFNTAADAVVTATQEQQIRSSFDFSRRSFGAQATRRLTREVSITGNYQIQKTKAFNLKEVDPLLIDRLFGRVRLSSFSGSLIGDTRDDAVEPGSGYYWSVFEQVAGRRIGSEVGFAKSFFTGQIFKTLPHTRHIVLAGDARLGLATGFPRDVPNTDVFGLPFVDVVKDLPASERFFAGGDTTVRGFALDTLGAPDTIKNGFPLGGNGLVIFNAELRVPVKWGVGVVGFFDTGNVFARATDIDLAALRSAVGVGLRYKSPLGPFRIDVGFKLRREEITPGKREGLTAWHFSFGQAF